MTQKIVPNIWCNRNAEEAGAFYSSAFAGASTEVESRYPDNGLLDFQKDFGGAPLTVGVSIPDPAGENPTRFVLINAGDHFRPNSSISFLLNFDPLFFGRDEAATRASLDQLWQELSSGGTVHMPLGEYDHSSHYGWVEDRFGVNWQLMLTDPDGASRPFIVPALMFAGPVQNRAVEAIEACLDVFEDSSAGPRYPYGVKTGPASAEAIMYGDFRIGSQWFAAMDSGVEQETTFSSGVSFEVQCQDQAEIDRIWAALSTIPEAEQCGWCVDQFGISWQIVPANMAELMERPGAWDHMMNMKKIVIDEL